MSGLWPIVISGLPYGVTPDALRRCIEEALDDHPVFPQTPKIVNDKALVYLPARDIQNKIAARNITLRCGGTIVKVEKISNQQAAQWNQPLNKPQNPAPDSNISKFVKQRQTEVRKMNKQMENDQKEYLNETHSLYRTKDYEEPPMNDSYPYDWKQPSQYLHDYLPTFNDPLVWYQYLSHPHFNFFSTFNAQESWDIEGQWVYFQKQYVKNAQLAESKHSTTTISNERHSYTIDLLNMRVIDIDTNTRYELKRVQCLTGIISSYGQIEVEFTKDTKEVFLYDTKTGYDKKANENDINIGDCVSFKVWWNEGDSDKYQYDVTHMIQPGNIDGNLHLGMLAFDVHPQNISHQHANESNSESDPYQLEYLTFCKQPLIVNQITIHDSIVFMDSVHGMIVLLNKGEYETGLIVCYPFKDKAHEPLMLMYHSRYKKWENEQFGENDVVQCCVGIMDSKQCGAGFFKYVALDIVKSDKSVSYPFPVALNIEREHRGSIVVEPNPDYGFIYNEKERNIVVLLCDPQAQSVYKQGMQVAYNESVRHNAHKSRNQYFANDVLPIEKVDKNVIISYYSDYAQHILKSNANQYVQDSILHKKRNLEFKEIAVAGDCERILQECYTMTASAIVFGVAHDGRIVGQRVMNRAKREYIEHALNERLKDLKPWIEFKAVIDNDGCSLLETYVIIVSTQKANNPRMTIFDANYVMEDEIPEHKENDAHYHQANEAVHVVAPAPEPVAVVCDPNAPIFTTVHLNSQPIPPSTKEGKRKLKENIQIKLNEMLKFPQYKDTEGLSYLLEMMDTELHSTNQVVWQQLLDLEKNVICEYNKSVRMKAVDKKIADQSLKFTEARDALRHKPASAPVQMQMQMQPQPIQSQYMHNRQDIGARPLVDNMFGTEFIINEKETKGGMMSGIDIPIIQESDCDQHGYPILPDASKYKAVAREYCQKMGWKEPMEQVQYMGLGYRATVSFGKPGKEKSASGEGPKQKSAAYAAYRKLVPLVIPKANAMDLMVKWLPGYIKPKKIITSTLAGGGQAIPRHPKSIFLEFVNKRCLPPAKATWSELSNVMQNYRIWICKVEWGGQEFEHKATKKKDAESKCYQELLSYVMNLPDYQ